MAGKKVTKLVRTLKKKRWKLALAESMTGGLAAHEMAGAMGTSDVFTGSIVCYSPEAKKSALGISQTMIDKYTTESQEVTDALAKNLQRVIRADIYASVTGLASPGGSETKEKPVGTVFFSLKLGRKILRRRKVFSGSPLKIRKKACKELYSFITEKVQISGNK
jgi:nicotinamide-nucleotide amidase